MVPSNAAFVVVAQNREEKESTDVSSTISLLAFLLELFSLGVLFLLLPLLCLFGFNSERQLPSAQQAADDIDRLVRANDVCSPQGDQPAVVADLLRRGGHLLGQVRGKDDTARGKYDRGRGGEVAGDANVRSDEESQGRVQKKHGSA